MIKTKVLLIDPPGFVSGFNTGLGYIAGALAREKIAVTVLDFNTLPAGAAQRLGRAAGDGVELAGLSIKATTLEPANEIASFLKEKGLTTVAGGPEVTLGREKFLEENPCYDFAFTGETERTFIEFVKNPKAGAALPGFCSRANGKFSCNECELARELDSLPFPDYSVFDSVTLIKDRYPLVTSRGCPYDCIYCAVNKISGRPWRKRSPENVIEELVSAKKRHGVRRFVVEDDNFTMDVERAKKICRLMIEKKLLLGWACINGIRADRLDEELLRLMKESGCDSVWLGVESLNEEVFTNIRKGEKLEKIYDAVGLAKKAGISVSGFFIVGLPLSTYEKDLGTLKKARKLGLDEALWSIATPLPHTELWEWAQKNAKTLQDYRKASFFKRPNAVFETPDYPAARREKMYYKANLACYSYGGFFPDKIGPGDILRFLWLIVRYDALNIPGHVKKILFGKYHRKYLGEFFKRLKVKG